jgi:hypothetical protein
MLLPLSLGLIRTLTLPHLAELLNPFSTCG